MDNPSQCKALNVSDEKQCLELATSVNGHFCSFHSKQCQGLYRGYKIRNAKLDRLTEKPPKYLAESKVPLSNNTFQDVSEHETLKELHDHLFLKFQLLERVIRARKLHHSRFFSLNMDYGHAKFLDSLQGQKAATLKALERLEKRTAELLYKKQKWFTWVKECQDLEETTRDKEQKKVKAEAAMFKRHWKATELRQRDLRAKENRLRQDAYLEQIYKDRMAEREKNGESLDTEDDEMEWDPIEDVLEGSNGSYLDLIRTFLWLATPESNVDATEESSAAPNPGSTDTPQPSPQVNVETPEGPASNPTPTPPKPKSKNKKKKKASNAPPGEASQNTPPAEPNKSLIETRQEMHDRLKNGENFNDDVVGLMIGGTLENPIISTKSLQYPEEEIARLQAEIFQIKHLLFCRLLLGQAALLPAALRADSVEEFLADADLTPTALRDLCLKMENPGLQEIRDACADLFRPDEEDEEEPEQPKDDSANKPKSPEDMTVFPRRKGDLPDKWIPKGEKAQKIPKEMMPDLGSMWGPEGDLGNAVDFSSVPASSSRSRKIKVKICGRTIWNYPSNKAMSRGGWLHFCIIAKESSLHDAIALCRHWDEFFELNILSIWGYFTGPNWGMWSANRFRQQMLQLGFISYYETSSPDAADLTIRHQQGGRRGQTRRSHAVFEARNVMCAHIKRDDQSSRRLVQYLSTQSYRVLVLVRDAETGNLLIKPPEDQRWIYREKSGLGRAVKNDWNILKSIGPEFFEEMERHRKWKFSFKEYYDVYVWDLEPGEPFPVLYNTVQEMVTKALRCRSPVDLYNLAAPIMKTLYKDKETHRVRDLKPGDENCLYDEFLSPDTKFRYSKIPNAFSRNATGLEKARAVYEKDGTFPRNYFYNDIDESEDAILFPEELEAKTLDPSDIGKIDPLNQWEQSLTIRNFVQGYDPDDETSDDSDEDEWMDEDDFDEDDLDEDDLDEDDLDEDDDKDVDENDEEVEEMIDEPSSPMSFTNFVQKMPWSTELKEAMAKLSLRDPLRGRQVPEKPTNDYMHGEFMLFLDREKAKIFKEIWHKADLAPHAQTRYIEMLAMAKKCLKYNMKTYDCAPTILCMNLQCDLDLKDYMYSRDLKRAVARITPFFHKDFLESESGSMFKDSLLFKQEERAKETRNTRSHHSNMTRPKEFFKEFESVMTQTEDYRFIFNDEVFEKWDRAIRPIIAHLYKSGIIRSRAEDNSYGIAFAGQEPGSDKYDFYQEQRSNMESFRMLLPMSDPHKVPPLKTFARSFATKHVNARFAVLSLWSAPHFYPLMIGWDKCDDTSFRDLTGRTWNWKFVPKDMPNSEWSIHYAATQRIEPYKKYLKDRVVVKREKFLVMGTDEKDLFRLTAVTAFAIQNRPWRQEVDLWKSFINVDAQFVEGLDEWWLE